jgi:F5/8 type C domain
MNNGPTPTPSLETVDQAATPPPEGGGLWEWLWRGRALARARSSERSFGRVVRERLQRAQLAAELAGRALDPVEPLRSGPSVPLALSLDREAAYWALLAQDTRYDARDLAGAMAVVPHDVLVYAAGDEHELVEVRSALVEQTFIDSAAEPIDIVMRKAKTVRAFVDALIERAAGPAQQAERLLLERWLRVSMLLVSMVAAVAIGSSYGIDAMRGPDLAAGKPWKTSSKAGDCDAAQRRCLGVATAILFHTVEEENPWYEIDLGSQQPFSKVEVQNRTDCCPERAVPLVVEVSNDGKKYTEVARKPDSFSYWVAELKSPAIARYVRLRVARRSLLHLERVSVRP